MIDVGPVRSWLEGAVQKQMPSPEQDDMMNGAQSKAPAEVILPLRAVTIVTVAGIVMAASAAGQDAAPTTGPADAAPVATSAPATAEAPGPMPVQGRWRRLADMPVGVFDAAVSRCDDRLVITGGFDAEFQSVNTIQILDLNEMSWRTGPPMRLPRTFHTQTTLADGRILVAGGLVGRVRDRLRETASCELIDLEAGTSRPIAPLHRTISDHTAHRLDNEWVVVIGGLWAQAYDPVLDKWVRRVQLGERRRAHASCLLDEGRVLIVGGLGRSTIEIVDVEQRTSRTLAVELPQPLDDLCAVRLSDGRIWIAGGQDTRTGQTTDRSYFLTLDPLTLSAGPDLGIDGGCADHFMVQLGRHVLVGGGEAQQTAERELSAARLLDVDGDALLTMPDMHIAHDDALAWALDPQRALVIGGFRMQPDVVDRPRAEPVVELFTLEDQP